MSKVNEISDVVKGAEALMVPAERHAYGEAHGEVNLLHFLEEEGITLEQAIEIIGAKRGKGKVYWDGEKFMNHLSYHVK